MTDTTTTDTTTTDTTTTDTSAPAPAPAKRPGRPRKGEQPMTPAQRQRLYKQRQKTEAAQLQWAAVEVENAAVDDNPGKLASAPRGALLRVLTESLDVLDSNKTDQHRWRRNVARRLLNELARRYDVNRESDEIAD